MTINEETEEDVENELDPGGGYTLKRTLSCPEQRSLAGGPIAARRDKSTKDLVKKLQRLKQTIGTESESDSVGHESSSDGGYAPSARAKAILYPNNGERPPRSPQKVVNANPDANTSAQRQLESGPGAGGSVVSMDTESDAPAVPSSGPSPGKHRTGEHTKNLASSPSKLESKLWQHQNGDRWKHIVLPPTKDNNTPSKDSVTGKTVDISDETSDTGCTRSTLSEDSDRSFEESPRHLRSKSVGRAGRSGKKNRRLRVSSSLSPTRSSRTPPANISSLARESRIRRLQLRKGYLPLDNERAESPTPEDTFAFHRSNNHKNNYSRFEEDDEQLTPKRKTTVLDSSLSNEDHCDNDSDLPDGLFQPTLLDDSSEPCPEFDSILDHLDLQLIDLKRPIGAEYGDDEESM